MPFSKQVTLTLAASSTAGIAKTQTGTPATALTLNGGLVVGSIAIMDVPRRIAITSTANDTGVNFSIVGTDYWGNVQTESLAGSGTSSAITVRDFATVSSITPNTTTAGTVQAGTTSTASSPPWVVDQWTNPSSIGVGTIVGTVPVNYTVEIAYDNLFPSWNIATTTPTWYGWITGSTTNTHNSTTEPLTMARVTVNSGTGSITANFRQAFISGRG